MLKEIRVGNVAVQFMNEDELEKIIESQQREIQEQLRLNDPRITITVPYISRWQKLFGSWEENGNEDKLLERLYESRLIQSTQPQYD